MATLVANRTIYKDNNAHSIYKELNSWKLVPVVHAIIISSSYTWAAAVIQAILFILSMD